MTGFGWITADYLRPRLGPQSRYLNVYPKQYKISKLFFIDKVSSGLDKGVSMFLFLD